MVAGKKGRSRGWRIFRTLVIVLALVGVLVACLPWLLSTAVARRNILSIVNRSMDGNLDVQDWEFAWVRGVRIINPRFTLKDNVVYVAGDALNVNMSIPDMMRAGLAFKKASSGRPVKCPLKGKVEFVNGVVGGSTPAGEEVFLSDLNVNLDVKDLDAKWPLRVRAKQDEGNLSVDAEFLLLSGGVFDPNSVSGDAVVTIDAIDPFPLMEAFDTNNAMPKMSGALNGQIMLEMAGISSLNATGSVSMGPVELRELNGVAVEGRFEPLVMDLLVQSSDRRVDVKSISVNGEFLRADVNGVAEFGESNALSKADFKLGGGLDTGKLLSLVAGFMNRPAPKQDSSRIVIDGTVAVDMKGGTNIMEAINASLAASVQGIDIGAALDVFNTNTAVPEVDCVLSANMRSTFSGPGSFTASAAGSVGPQIRISVSEPTPISHVFDAVAFNMKASGDLTNINLSALSVTGGFAQVSCNGNVLLGPSNALRKAVLDLDTRLDTAEITKLAAQLLRPGASGMTEPAGGIVTLKGSAGLDNSGQSNLLDSVNADMDLVIDSVDIGALAAVFNTNSSAALEGSMNGQLALKARGVSSLSSTGAVSFGPFTVALDGKREKLDKMDLVLDVSGQDGKVTLRSVGLRGNGVEALVDGAVMLGASNALESITAAVDVSLDLAPLVALAGGLTGRLADAGQGGGAVGLKASISNSPIDPADLMKNMVFSADLEAKNVSLGPLVGLAPPGESVPKVNGLLDAGLTLSGKGKDSVTVRGGVSSPGLKLSGGAFGDDTPAISDIQAKFDLAVEGQGVRIDAMSLKSSLATLDMKGNAAPAGSGGLFSGDISMNAEVSLAQLAGQFPHTLKMRDDVRISDGSLETAVRCSSSGSDMKFDVNGRVAGLKASRSGKEFGLDKPVSLDLKGVYGADLELESIFLESSFVNVRGKGNLRNLSVKAEADLKAAFSEAAKFVDLSGKDAGGKAAFDARISQVSGGSRLVVDGRISDLRVAGYSKRPISLQSLSLDYATTLGFGGDGRLSSLSDTEFNLACDLVEIALRNKRFVPESEDDTMLDDLTISLSSDLGKVMKFLAGITDLPDGLELAGVLSAGGACAINGGVLRVTDADLKLDPFTMKLENGLLVDRGIEAGGKVSLPVKAVGSPDLPKMCDASMKLTVGHVSYLGVNVADVEVPLELKSGKGSVHPRSKVNDGSIDVPVGLDFVSTPAMISIPDNTMALKNINLTDEMVNELLGMIAPILRGCAVTSGGVSLQMRRCKVPMDMDKRGMMQMSCSTMFRNVVLAPSGLMFNILEMAGLQNESITIPDQDVSTEFRDGRFWSTPLKVMIGAHAMVISGSVGLDESLDYVVRVPLTRKLVGKDVLDYLDDQSLELPVGGTASKPSIDKKKFMAQVAKLGLKAATSEKGKELLMKEGQKLLDGIFGK